MNVEYHGDALVLEASALLSADAQTAWRVLTDYAHYDRIVPGVRSAEVVARDGSHVTVRQSGEATVWSFRAPIDLVYDIVETPPTHLQSRIASGCACAFESSYTLTPSGSHVVLDYRGRLVAASDARGIAQRSAMSSSLTAHLQALADEIENATSGDPTQQPIGESARRVDIARPRLAP